MCISFFAIVVFKEISNNIRTEELEFKDYDMYSKDDYSEVIGEINNYLSMSNDTIESIKSRELLINDDIHVYYDSEKDKFNVNYKYKGLVYKKTLTYIENNHKVVFLPLERRYISQ